MAYAPDPSSAAAHGGQHGPAPVSVTRLRPAVARRAQAGARLAFEAAVFYGTIASFAAASLVWSLAAWPLYHVLPRRTGMRVGQAVIRAGFRFVLGSMRLGGLFKLDLSALDAVRDETCLVVAPNHPTLLDAVLIISRLPRVVCITKASIWDNPFLGGGARLAGYIRNDAPHLLIRRAARAVADGNQLLIFPEGTRTVRPPVNDFKGGFAVMARRGHAPIQTVFIETSSPYISKGWPVLRMPAFPIAYRATLGRRFAAAADTQAFIAELEEYYRRELERFHPDRTRSSVPSG